MSRKALIYLLTFSSLHTTTHYTPHTRPKTTRVSALEHKVGITQGGGSTAVLYLGQAFSAAPQQHHQQELSNYEWQEPQIVSVPP